MIRGARRADLAFGAILIASGLIASFTLTSGHDWGDDFAAYLLQAQAILQGAPGEFVHGNRVTIERSVEFLGPVVYPWGFPLLLTPFLWGFGLDPIALKVPGLGCFLAVLGVLWLGVADRLSVSFRLMLVSILAFNPSFLLFLDNILSDIPFLLAASFALVLMDKWTRTPMTRSAIRPGALLGVALAVAFLVRVNGALLMPVLAASTLLNGRLWELLRARGASLAAVLAMLSPYVVCGVLALLWTAVLPSGDYVSTAPVTLLTMTRDEMVDQAEYYALLPASFYAGLPNPVGLYVATLPFFLVGATRATRRDLPFLVYLVFSLALFVTWHQRQGLRFIMPVLPFYVLFMLMGVEAACSASRRHARAWRALALLVLWCIVMSFALVSLTNADNIQRDRHIDDGPFTADASEMFEFVRTQTPADSVIVFFKPRALKLLTGRQSFQSDRLQDLVPGMYVCLYLATGGYNQLQLDTAERLMTEGRLQAVSRSGRYALFRVEY